MVTELDSPAMIELLRKKKKGHEVSDYQRSVANYNAHFKAVVEKWWPYEQEVLYMTFQEADRLRRAKVKDAAVLYCAHIENFTTKGDEGARKRNGLDWPENFKTVNQKREHWDTYTVMELKLIEELGKDKPVFSQNLANILPDGADLVFGLQMFLQYVKAAEDNHNVESRDLMDVLKQGEKSISEKTLLLPKKWLHPYLVERTIQAAYNYPYQIADNETYQHLVESGDSAYAYVQIIPEVLSKRVKIKTNYLHLVLDVSDGTLLAVYKASSDEDEDKVISKNSLKEYAQQARNNGLIRR